MARVAAVLVMSLMVLVRTSTAEDTCRMDPSARHNYCGLPVELSNFQGYYQCNSAVKVGRPANVQDVQTLVTMFPKVRANGVGHSWWKEQFCAGNDSNSINLVMTELGPVLSFIENPVDPAQWRNSTIPVDFPIQVDEDAGTVTVAAGIPQRELLDYLASYTHWKQPLGWTLPAFSWFIDQTIGGAVATATHGSSMRWGSLSSQIRGMKVVLANGTIYELNNPQENLHLWRALGVSVGRLGVITELTMRIKPQQAVQRKLQDLTFNQFASQIKATQEAYVAAKTAGDKAAIQSALFQVDETQALWQYGANEVWRTDYKYLGHEPSEVILNINESDPQVQAMDGPGPSSDVFAQVYHQPVPPNMEITRDPRYWGSVFYPTTMRSVVTPGVYAASHSYITMTEFGTRFTSSFAPYNQLEVAVPLEKAGDCLLQVGAEMYGPQNLWEGFRAPALVRFVTGEDFYLSPTNGGPRMYVNMEDYLSLSTGQPNVKFNAIVDTFIQHCDARLHWGKYGWQEFNKCFDGATAYPDTWCDFGCAVDQLDPTGKFASESNVWRWNATNRSGAVDFASCCTAEGFDKARCQCAPSPLC